MAYTFARVGAALSMNVGDYFPQGKQWSVWLREKGGKRKQIAVHHLIEEYMDAYISAAGLAELKGTPLFRTARGKTGVLTESRMTQPDAWRMLQRRAKKAGMSFDLPSIPVCARTMAAAEAKAVKVCAALRSLR